MANSSRSSIDDLAAAVAPPLDQDEDGQGSDADHERDGDW